MPVTNCRYFNGYKPCLRNSCCDESCLAKDIPTVNILLIHLGAIGAVVRSTSLLSAIKRKYPGCRLIWVTEAPAHKLLQGHPLLDQVYSTSDSDLLELSSWDFDIALVVDKSRKAGGILKRISVDQIFGFEVDSRTGAVLPTTPAADELWQIGLSDQKKFFLNTKPETQLIHEALELGPWPRDEYNLPLSFSENELAKSRRRQWLVDIEQVVIGINTGASPTIPYKKWTVEYQRSLVQKLLEVGFKNIVLLGGPEDTERNLQIAKDLPVVQSPTNLGLRDGLCSVEACDLVITGDSLGMHMAIARKKYVVAWFGPTCAHEIDLYDRGEKIIAKAPCGPCWKRVCDNEKMCYDLVDIKDVLTAAHKGISFCQKNQFLSFKQPSSEICF